MVCNFVKKKTLVQVFSCKFSKIIKKTYFVEHVWMDAWVKLFIKPVFIKSIYRKTPVMASSLVQLQTCGFIVFPKGTSWKVLFYENCEVLVLVLQNNAARLFLISCDIFNISLDLSVMNQFSHSMEI